MQDIGEAQAAQFERSLGRISALESYLPAQEEPTIVRVKDLEIYLGRGDVFRAGRRIHFTFQEFKLISALSGTPGETVTKEILIQALDLGEYERGAAANNLKVTIQHIRKKFGERAKQPRYIATSWGHGYRLLTD